MQSCSIFGCRNSTGLKLSLPCVLTHGQRRSRLSSTQEQSSPRTIICGSRRSVRSPSRRTSAPCCGNWKTSPVPWKCWRKPRDMSEATPRVLLVEDNPMNLELATDLLEACGIEVISANTGEAAVKLAQERSPNLILMDLSLPGMDGLQAT